MAPPATPATAKKRPAATVAPKRTRYRAWDTAIAVAVTMGAYFSWQLTSDPGLGGMFLDSMCSHNHECAIDWVGDRVAIRGMRANDIDRLFDIKTAEGVADYQLYDPPKNIMDVHGNFLFPYIAAQLRKSLIPKALMLPWYNAETRSRRVFGIARKSDKDRELVGIVGVYGYYDRSRKVKEIHYELHPSVWRLGYMTESLSMVLDHVFTSLPHEVDAVTASIFPDNVASEKLLKKLWFLYDHSLENGMQVYRLGKDRWFKRKAGKEAPSKKDVKEEEASEADVEDA